MKRILLIVILAAACTSLSAQLEARFGTVVDRATSQPIPRASVGISGTETGTYAHSDGTFSLQRLSTTDTLIFSALGYLPLRFSMREIPDTIRLQALSYDLPTVDFVAKKEKEQVVGLGFQKRKIRGGLIPPVGNQFARYVANPYGEEGLLAAATFQFSRGIRSLNSGGLFRVRVFARKPNMNTFHPGQDLLLETVEFATSWKGGFINIPLREYGIAFPPEGLFIGLEYLAPAGNIPIWEDGRTTGPIIGKYTTTNGTALTFARYRDNFWSIRNLPRWQEEEVPNMAFGAVVVFRR
ncbi:carboxypeptidase-like regulatory domain-containing protein [Neolewinella agarilytica]|uniref:CarboxypepD_reg-like domain-containing protein n=1 Tax=Neolewinella agarilytica TaxID=478744 RepID=A0A1H9JPR5_9BACT|nr:carboxypeptidase-like regulatory domain-containing protein [Neolewinella agarilytica]SEQ88779.1 CarboxypepD_reg-like domain-containing protein [Neolewinella agarilytica]